MPPEAPEGEEADSPFLRLRRRSWAKLISKVWLEDPSLCRSCQKPMKIIAVISREQEDVIERVLRHLYLWDPPWKRPRKVRGPPPSQGDGSASSPPQARKGRAGTLSRPSIPPSKTSSMRSTPFPQTTTRRRPDLRPTATAPSIAKSSMLPSHAPVAQSTGLGELHLAIFTSSLGSRPSFLAVPLRRASPGTRHLLARPCHPVTGPPALAREILLTQLTWI